MINVSFNYSAIPLSWSSENEYFIIWTYIKLRFRCWRIFLLCRKCCWKRNHKRCCMCKEELGRRWTSSPICKTKCLKSRCWRRHFLPMSNKFSKYALARQDLQCTGGKCRQGKVLICTNTNYSSQWKRDCRIYSSPLLLFYLSLLPMN